MSEAADQTTQQTDECDVRSVVVRYETTGSFCTTSNDGDGNVQYSRTAIGNSLCEVGTKMQRW
jgi:hypothetical protein